MGQPGLVDSKFIVTCALTGAVTSKKQCPAIPYTAEEIGEEAKRAHEAGAAVVHVHGREDDGTPSYRPEVFAAYKTEIEQRSPVIVNFSTGAVGLSKEDRIGHVLQTKPAIGALNMGSMNYAKYSRKRKGFVFSFVFENSFDDIIYYLSNMNEVGVRPELECFDTGHVASTQPLIELGLLNPPYDFNFVLGILGGMSATPEHLAFQASHLPKGALWKTTAVSRMTWPITGAALALGGNVRVGLEDNFYLPNREMVQSNGDLVDHAVRMGRDVGREPATVDEARSALGLGS